MSEKKNKKYSGVKFLKVEHSFLLNVKRLNSLCSSNNDSSMNSKSKKSQNDKRINILNTINNKEDRIVLSKSNSINNNSKMNYYLNKLKNQSSKNLLIINKAIQLKKEIELSKLNKQIIPIKIQNRKFSSTKNLNNIKNRFSKKSLFFTSNKSNNNDSNIINPQNNNKANKLNKDKKKKDNDKNNKK